MPGLAARPEDIEPNFDYELEKFSRRSSRRMTINKEARELFLGFAISSEGLWIANFRDLAGAVTRMATLADNGRIAVTELGKKHIPGQAPRS
jgi:transcriptional regulatory protein RtcR